VSAAAGTSAPTATRSFDAIEVGEALPELVLPLTRTLIVSTALASRDYQDVHHDPVLAAERGSKDIFMNILSTNGIVGRYVTDWSGPGAVLTDVNIRLGAPNYPDDTMTLTGEVASKEDVAEAEGRGAVWATTSPGRCGCSFRGPARLERLRTRSRGTGRADERDRPLLHGQHRHRGHRCHRVLEGVGPQ
jgi:hypothetical protein